MFGDVCSVGRFREGLEGIPESVSGGNLKVELQGAAGLICGRKKASRQGPSHVFPTQRTQRHAGLNDRQRKHSIAGCKVTSRCCFVIDVKSRFMLGVLKGGNQLVDMQRGFLTENGAWKTKNE